MKKQAGNTNVDVVYYTVLTKRKGYKKYMDKRWCYCSADKSAHIHPKGHR